MIRGRGQRWRRRKEERGDEMGQRLSLTLNTVFHHIEDSVESQCFCLNSMKPEVTSTNTRCPLCVQTGFQHRGTTACGLMSAGRRSSERQSVNVVKGACGLTAARDLCFEAVKEVHYQAHTVKWFERFLGFNPNEFLRFKSTFMSLIV